MRFDLTQSTASDARQRLVACLQQVAAGDAEALRQVYLLTAPKLHRVARDLLHNRDEADEVVHEAFLAVWTNAHRFDPVRASPITWLVVIVRNRAIDRLRLRRTAGFQMPLAQGTDIADGQPDPFATAASRSDALHLRRCLDVLDARTRRFITRRFFEGRLYEEVAQEEGVPLGTVKTVIRRGLIRLREEWERDPPAL